MKIGIINVQWFDNPGAVLLCYSLQKFIDAMGFDSLVIDYAKGGSSIESEKNHFIQEKFKGFISKVRKLKRYDGMPFYRGLRLRSFNYELFRNNYIHKTQRFTECNISNFEKCDAYVVGSDVVWKPAIVNSEDAYVYFLSFAKEISYAASIGTTDNNLLEKYESKYKDYLRDFDSISVREEQTAEFLKDLLKREIITLLDPVFLMNAEEYIEDLNLHSNDDEYIYFYILEDNMEAVEFVRELSRIKKLKIIYDLHSIDKCHLGSLLGKNAKASISDGPKEFLEKIMNAKYVVTNSFHGTAFSIIFKKRFYTFSCTNSTSNVSVRMESLLNKLNLMSRYNSKEDFIDKCEIDYEKIENIISEEVTKAREFLLKSIGA